MTPPPPPLWKIKPAPGGIVNWGLRYVAQFFFLALFVGWTVVNDQVSWQVALAAVVAGPLLAGMVAGWLYWRSFEVELSAMGLTVRRGIFTMRTDFVAYARMQSVVVKQGPIQRLLGIGDVLVQSAKQNLSGSGEQRERRNRSVDANLELRFEGIVRNVREFEHVRGFLLERAEQARVAPVPEGAPVPVPGSAPAGAPPRTAMPADLPALFAGAAGAVHQQLTGAQVPVPAAPAPAAVHLQPRARTLWTVRWSVAVLIFYLPVAVFLPWPFLAAAPAWVAVAYLASRVYYGHYHVTLQPEAIEVERGLLTLRRAVVPYRRVQNVNVVAGPLERSLGLKTLRIEAAGPAIGEGYIDGLAGPEAEPLVTFLMGRAERARFDDALGDQAAARDARAQAVDELRAINMLLEQRAASAAGRAGALGGGEWLPGPNVLSRRWPAAVGLGAALSGLVLWVLLALPLLLFLARGQPLGWAASALLFVGAPGVGAFLWARARLAFFAFRFGPETLEVRHGVLFRSHDLIPYRRLQSVGVSSGPLERRVFGIWSIRISTAGTTTGLTEFPGLSDPRPYADFLLAKARLSSAPSGESPVVELAAEAQRTAVLVASIRAARA